MSIEIPLWRSLDRYIIDIFGGSFVSIVSSFSLILVELIGGGGRGGGRRVISDPLDDTSLTLKFVKIRFDSVSSIASTIKRTIKQSFSPFIFPLDFCSLLIRFIPKHNVIVHSIRLAKSDSRFVRDFFPSPNFK